MALHECKWHEDIAINEYFTFRKEQVDIIGYSINQAFNIVYYDAFAPTAQPELWTTEIFNKLNSLLFPEGILVTYCSKGDVRRAMQKAGLIVEKIPGPPGKREMVRAFKI
jgi:tRNA U34 5-methylaminomethyl-2-thiouridine-forming methyltransferase MnmC